MIYKNGSLWIVNKEKEDDKEILNDNEIKETIYNNLTL